MLCSLASRPTINDVCNCWRNAEKWNQEDFIRVMEYLGFKHKDFTGDGEGTRYTAWYYRTRREIDVSPIWWGGNAQLIFYTDKETPIPDHPRKGQGKFKAIYLHNAYGVCDVSLVEAEIVNVQARLEYIDGAKLMVSRTSPSRLLPYRPATFELMQKLRSEALLAYQKYEELRKTSLHAEWQASYNKHRKRST